MLRIRLNTQELDRLKAEAERRELSMSEVIRDYIKRMPKPKKGSDGLLDEVQTPAMVE
ncbi:MULTISPECIES: ribbon-helix-helix protein, CopG family [Oscillatoriales]|uniref:Ribbon-helix-helix protein, copG family n=2 Tax=Oscillatoriales TaxID=1150 RepID=K9TJ24_9CYAN|nr:ribbon-helix-helix protein, CopG family [Oscillatoria acuminata]AFY82024.1 Ribbon-helix-helix protein, copG family [Oscillatoria acuminata PCC 6304]MCT7956645.1 ribbon-helix-helix protein, CopG family [Laspinema sp. D2c]MCT7959615.1 ribbon-helix-helix protein, CopG family [Laspinema sp. D2b]MCT7967360.1 ribbon-helix-helix protein, CopG family [Laspinema sp. D2a]